MRAALGAVVWLVAEQKTEPAAVARRKREPPRRGEVRRAAESSATTVASARHLKASSIANSASIGRGTRAISSRSGIEPELVEPGAVKRAGLARAEIGRDPERLLARFTRERRERNGEAGRVELAGCRAQLVQGRAGQASAERGIDRADAERPRARLLGQRFARGNGAAQARKVLLHRLDREHEGTVCSWFVLLIPLTEGRIEAPS